VLDTATVPSIIYIWYEGSQLRPALVKLEKIDHLEKVNRIEFRSGGERQSPMREAAARKPAGRQVAARSLALSQTKPNPNEGGDKRQWRRKPRAGRRRPARNAKLTSPVDKRGWPSPPLSMY
jgi:hypothetical protein